MHRTHPLRAGEAALAQKLTAINGEEKKQLKALEAEKTARLKSKIAGLAELTKMNKAVEKQRVATADAHIKAERKKLEKLAKEVAANDDKKKSAEEALEIRVGELERATADKISTWRAAHKATLDKMAAAKQDLDNRTRELIVADRTTAQGGAEAFSQRIGRQ